MKKHFRTIAFMLAIISLFASIAAMSVSAAPVPGTYYDTTAQYTRVTDTYGYSGVSYTGGYYGVDHPDNFAKILADCRGGTVDAFLTSIYIFVHGDLADGPLNDRIPIDSDMVGRYVSYSYTKNLNTKIGPINGYVEERSESKTDSSDYWEYNYLMYWRSASGGWG